jgi:hypothetical protein
LGFAVPTISEVVSPYLTGRARFEGGPGKDVLNGGGGTDACAGNAGKDRLKNCEVIGVG